MIIDPRNEDLVSGSGNANSSPWVLAIKQAGISALPSIVNACILISAWSAGNSYCWVGSRMIVAMTTDRQLPQVFGRVTKKGVPYVAVITAWLFGPLAYLSQSHPFKASAVLTAHRSWDWRSGAGFQLAAQFVYCCWSDRLGYPVPLLHSLPQSSQSSRRFASDTTMEEFVSTLHRLGWLHW
jgi:amino acid transporter